MKDKIEKYYVELKSTENLSIDWITSRQGGIH